MNVKFEDIAFNSIAKKKPVASDKNTYLGLEHLDSGNLTVTRFGSDIAPIGEKLLMKKGDVLFGKRRAYQKKVAIAPFDGIFSAHGMVLRPKEQVVFKDFFPLFISSDYFLDAAIKISVGSLSPTINWSALKELEFDLPPIAKQRKLAGLLWVANTTREAYKKLLNLTDQIVKSRFVEMFGDPVTNPMGWEKVFWRELFNTTTGKFDSNAMVANGEYPFFTCAKEEYRIDTYAFDCEALLLAGNNATGVYDVKHYSGKFNAYQRTYVITLKNQDYSYIPFKLMLEEKLGQMQELSKGTNTKYLTMTILESFDFIVPPLSLQNRFAEFVKQADKSEFEIQRTIDELEATYKSILRENLG
jgi:type I restriction enzyme S subunit